MPADVVWGLGDSAFGRFCVWDAFSLPGGGGQMPGYEALLDGVVGGGSSPVSRFWTGSGIGTGNWIRDGRWGDGIDSQRL